jgi:hypothetical protein
MYASVHTFVYVTSIKPIEILGAIKKNHKKYGTSVLEKFWKDSCME